MRHAGTPLPMRSTILLGFGLLNIMLPAQSVDWLRSDEVGHIMNPGMPAHSIASTPARVVVMRTLDVDYSYGDKAYGSVALDALDPVSGDLLLSCLLGDSVAVGPVVAGGDGIAYISGRFMGDALVLCDGSMLGGVDGGDFTVNHFLLAWDMVTGSFLWTRNLSLNHVGAEDVPSLAIDTEGRLWYLLRNFSEGFAVRVDAEGADAEGRAITGIRHFGTLSFDPAGGLYVSGSCENGTVAFGGAQFPVESEEGYNMFVLRFRPDGTAGFARFAEDITFQDPTVVADGGGGAYLAGGLFIEAVWGDVTIGGPEWGSGVFLAALDSTGHFAWGLTSAAPDDPFSGEMSRSKGPCITTDAQGHVYLMGNVRGNVEWGDGVVSGGTDLQERRLTVVAFHASGHALWEVTSDPTTWGIEGQTLTATAGGGVVHFAAHTADPFVLEGSTTGSDGLQSAVVGRLTDLQAGLGEASANGALHPWPNPAHDVVHLDHTGAVQPAELLDATGRIVRRYTLHPGRNTIPITGLCAGAHVLRVPGGGYAVIAVQP